MLRFNRLSIHHQLFQFFAFPFSKFFELKKVIGSEIIVEEFKVEEKMSRERQFL